jgi:PAS domain-containing protein
MSETDRPSIAIPPGRTEDPHGWLWRLLFEEVDRRLAEALEEADRVAVAGGLWEDVVAGTAWVRRDRGGLSRREPDTWLSDLVDAEAERHISLSADLDSTLDANHVFVLNKAARPREERQANIRLLLWRYLSSGWIRVTEEQDRIVFWDPASSEFVPYSPELNLTYVRLF